MHLGLVTYNLAKDWDIETIIENCQTTGFSGVELRTTHAHGVETELSPAQRQQVKERFADSSVELVGLGTAFEFDSVAPQEVQANIDGTKSYIELARDLGVSGVKVRPNKIHEDQGVPREKTFEQIGLALGQCGQFAAECDVEVRLEVHGLVPGHPLDGAVVGAEVGLVGARHLLELGLVQAGEALEALDHVVDALAGGVDG